MLGKVATLTVCVRAPEIRAEILDAFKRLKIDGGLCRTGSDGAPTFLYRYDDGYGSVYNRRSHCVPIETEPGVCLVGEERVGPMGQIPTPNALRVDGTWTKKLSPLEVPRDQLAATPDEDTVFAAVSEILRGHEPQWDYKQYMREQSAAAAASKPVVYQRLEIQAADLTSGKRARFEGRQRSGLGGT